MFVTKIFVTKNQYNYTLPWRAPSLISGTGSGCVIKGNRILTNAHVVSDAAFIEVQLHNCVRHFEAEAEWIADEYDLAILKVKYPDFFAPIKNQYLTLANNYKLREEIRALGFPKGGEKLCITEGIISRNEVLPYTHSGRLFLAAQIDSAINPGSSGGPVINKRGNIVGIAHQGSNEGQNIGYMIPLPILQHFLTQVKKEGYKGVPEIDITLEPMMNNELRNFYHMTEEQSGILVISTKNSSFVQKHLFPGDILLEIDDIPIDNDGTILLPSKERLPCSYLLSNKFFHDIITLKILRKGQILTLSLEIPEEKQENLVPLVQYNQSPSYYIIGGLVFQTLNGNYLHTWGENWYWTAPQNFLHYFFSGHKTPERQQIVILNRVLPDRATMGYENYFDLIISEVNGKKISTINDLITAFETPNNEKYHFIKMENGYEIILNKADLQDAHHRILHKYSIHNARSQDLN